MMQEQLITWGIPLLLLLVAMVLLLPYLQQWRERRCMEKRIAAVGTAQLKNVLLDDGMGGQSFFERLLLTADGILALQFNYRDGVIFAGERMDNWAQVMGARTLRFANPLYQIEAQLSTLRHHLPKLAVSGTVLFVGECSFPKGKPTGVWTLQDLTVAGSEEVPSPPPPFVAAWEEIGRLARAIDPGRDGYLLPVKEEGTPFRGLLALLLAGSALAWLLWRLL